MARPSPPAWIRSLGSLATVTLLFVLAPETNGQDVAALPDRDAFLQNVRSHLSTDRRLLSQYAYRELRTEYRRDRDGGVASRRVRLFEVYPSPVPAQTYRRLVAVNGAFVGREQLDKQDQEHARDVREWTRKMQREGKAGRLQIEEADARRERETIDEVFRLYDIRLTNREVTGGHQMIALLFTPRPDAEPQSGAGRLLKHFKGRAWVTERDYQLARIEAEAVDDVTIGFGLIARVYAGSRAYLERARMTDGAWLPVRAWFRASGRAFLFRRFNIEVLEELSEYQKIDVNAPEAVRFRFSPR